MYLVTGEPAQGSLLEKAKICLARCGLSFDPGAGFTAALMEEDAVIATGSLDGGVIKCVATLPEHQGEDLTGQIMTALLTRAAQEGRGHLMLYTKPRNQAMFTPFGFHPIIRTPDVLLMENKRRGLEDFLASLPKPTDDSQPVGCIVAHGNPFTRGHLYLVETAAAQCAWVHLFILSEDRGMFPADARLAMAKAACAHLPNVLVHPTGPYMVSAATFPSYFLKETQSPAEVYCETDVRLFGEKIAPALGITRRYVGTEPMCPVTAKYNAAMHRLLPEYGVAVTEVERRLSGDAPVSASRVRALLAQGRTEEARALVPDAVASYIR